MPGIKFHKATGQFYVWDGAAKRRVYLGTDEAQAKVRLERYRRGEPQARPADPDGAVPLTVSEILLAYYRARKASGVPSKELHRIKTAARITNRVCGREPAAEFRAKALKRVREHFLKARSRRKVKAKPKRRYVTPAAGPEPLGMSRRYINKLVNELKAAWTWAASEELIPPETAMSLRMVKNLRLGEGGREPNLVPAVEDWVVDATLPELGPVVAAMVNAERLGGMRPGEVCKLRPRDISTSPADKIALPRTTKTVSAFEADGVLVWVAVPESHKTLKRGKPRAIVLGPQVQGLLRLYLRTRGPDDPLFSPKESVALWLKAQKRKVHFAKSRMPGQSYTTQSYGKAIAVAVERANKKRAAADPPLPLLPAWRPNQLRHRAGTEVAEAFDRPTAAAFLGHAGVDVIDVYVEQELKKAGRAAAKLG